MHIRKGDTVEVICGDDKGTRGRVLSVFFLNRGLVPLGTMLAGLTARFVGAPLTVSIMGAVVVVLALTLMIRVPVVRELA